MGKRQQSGPLHIPGLIEHDQCLIPIVRDFQHDLLEITLQRHQNLRSTRETELAEEHPIHVVCKWLGNSQPVAAKHYLQVTDEHFEKAVELAGSAA